MNWGKLLTQALEIGVALKSISDIDAWLDDQINALQSGQEASAYVEMAYEIAGMNQEQWNYLTSHLGVKALRNNNAEHIFNSCNYVVRLQNNTITELLSYSIREAVDVLSYGVRDMKLYEIAAYYGVLKYYSANSMKARAILGEYNQLLLR